MDEGPASETAYNDDAFETSFNENDGGVYLASSLMSSATVAAAEEGSSFPQIFLKGKEGSVRVGGQGDLQDYADMSTASVIMELSVSTAKPLPLSIDKFVYTSRETFCDIMCTTNTSKMYVVPEVRSSNLKDTVATLPVTKRFSFSSAVKGRLPGRSSNSRR